MINIKLDKGITLASLIITVILILILSTITVYTIKFSNNNAPYNKMVTDIVLLEEKILNYYSKNGVIPVTAESAFVNGEVYNEIDLSKLANLTLNYGKDYGKNMQITESSDIYLIDNNFNIYYVRGIKESNLTYHTKTDTQVLALEYIKKLPREYQEVEYIESNGIQYIDTGFIANQN